MEVKMKALDNCEVRKTMKKMTIPTGLEHAINGGMGPDIRFACQFYAAHWRRVKRAWSYPEHTHTMFELNMVLDGEQRMTVGGQSIMQRAGDILFIRPGVVHNSGGPASGDEMEYFCLHFDVDDLTLRRSLLAMPKIKIAVGGDGSSVDVHGDPPPSIGGRAAAHGGRPTTVDRSSDANSVSASAKAEAAFRSALYDIAETVKREQSGSPRDRLASLAVSLRFLAALGEWVLAEEVSRLPLGPASPAATENAVALAAEIELRMQQLVGQVGGENAAVERVGIEKIAARLGYSPAYCNRIFRQTYGMSPRQYLSSLMIREAKLMLMDPNLTVEQVAERLGYRDVSQFSKQFKRWMNVSPMGFRRLSHE
jgi:AraC-like DNA-binding protein/mannose-6-phosphate isomerase-like protein (cupin superfamily)